MPHGHSEQFSLKSIKGIYIPTKIIIPCQFITDPLNPCELFSIKVYPHVNPTSHSKMKVQCAQ